MSMSMSISPFFWCKVILTLTSMLVSFGRLSRNFLKWGNFLLAKTCWGLSWSLFSSDPTSSCLLLKLFGVRLLQWDLGLFAGISRRPSNGKKVSMTSSKRCCQSSTVQTVKLGRCSCLLHNRRQCSGRSDRGHLSTVVTGSDTGHSVRTTVWGQH